MDENFPPKIYVGSAIATIGLVVKERFDELKSYLSTVLAIPGISQQQCVHHFVDVEFRGMSGFRYISSDIFSLFLALMFQIGKVLSHLK